MSINVIFFYLTLNVKIGEKSIRIWTFIFFWWKFYICWPIFTMVYTVYILFRVWCIDAFDKLKKLNRLFSCYRQQLMCIWENKKLKNLAFWISTSNRTCIHTILQCMHLWICIVHVQLQDARVDQKYFEPDMKFQTAMYTYSIFTLQHLTFSTIDLNKLSVFWYILWDMDSTDSP